MIVQRRTTTLRLITQNDHAHLAHELIRLWPSLGDWSRREAILDAVRLHDRGWHGIDASPVLDDDGRPCDFRNLPFELRREVWQRGLDADPQRDAATGDLVDRSPSETARALWAELLIAHHAWIIHRPDQRLLEGSSGMDSAHREFLVWLESARAAQVERVVEALDGESFAGAFAEALDLSADPGIPAESSDAALRSSVERALEHDYPWLRAADFLSLVACGQWPGPHELPSPDGPSRLEARGVDDRLEIHPYPLRGSYSLSLRFRELEDVRFESARELGSSLARASWKSGILRVCGEP